jgi:hypothetical protein
MQNSDQLLSHHSTRSTNILKVPEMLKAYCVLVHAERMELNVYRDRETKEIYAVIKGKVN